MTGRDRHHEHDPRRRHPQRARAIAAGLAVLLVTTTAGVAPRMAHEGGSTGARAAGVAARAVAVTGADTLTRQLIERGRRVYEGRDGGALCTTCHGPEAKGVKGLGPDLTDDVWLHGDGGLEFLRTIVRTGVMQPKQGGGVMPPYGGTPLQPDQLEAVAAYVYSLSHPSP